MIFLRKHILLIVLLTVYLLVSVLIAQDFGTPWDESEVYVRGEKLMQYFIGEYDYESYLDDKYGINYNHSYSMILNLLNIRGTYGMFHLLNLLIAVLLLTASYFLIFKRYRNTKTALLGPIFMILTPRLMGHIPANPKDGPFSIFYFLSLTAIVLTKDLRQIVRGVILGVTFWMALSIRILGLSLFMILFIFDVHKSIKTTKGFDLVDFTKNHILAYTTSALISFVLLITSWPYLHKNTLVHLFEVINTSSSYPWDGPVLFNSSFINATNLPASYIPTWILITTPLFILFLLLLSPLLVKNKSTNDPFIVLILALLINLAAYFILKPTVYDGLRHYLFLLPIVSTLASIAFIELLFETKSNLIVLLISSAFLINITYIVSSMIALHPYQYIYFNELIGGLKGAEGKFETDYYGASYREAALWLNNQVGNTNKEIKVKSCGQPFSSYYYFSANIVFTPNLDEADYFICYTRFNEHLQIPDVNTVHVVKRQDVPLNYIKKL